ncbi:MAG: hypothetical protein JJ866_15970 [Roseibium sp.]|uniref:hypothetical protein n=1 Tax=Roseibium sp. TaxID=1936156 RepID=UPI001B2418DF|nr:hypothetical protein [Roseibium sp.]MBO6893440.1 hypothetical protein [Roseibium sp.]MBO6930593.1 hypothetical protein [Roseibium sp.]
MKKISSYLLLSTFLTIQFAQPVAAADPYDAPSDHISTSSLRGSLGLRYWYSQTKSKLTSANSDVYRLDNVTSHTAEIVGELEDTTSNAFVRGYVGLGQNSGGDTSVRGVSTDLVDTALGYVVIDGGWQFAQFANNQVRLKGFVGYQYLNDDIETASVSSQTRTWNAIRLGMTAEGSVSDRLSWSVDLAGVPWAHALYDSSNSSIADNWDSNWTYGVEADAMLNLNLTKNWQVGLGGRYWWLRSNFEPDHDQSGSNPGNNDVDERHKQNYHRYGLLLESRYTF